VHGALLGSSARQIIARRPGAGRDRVAITPDQAISSLDSGLRRNDELGA